MLVNFCYNSWI